MIQALSLFYNHFRIVSEESYNLKEFFNAELVARLAADIKKVWNEFDTKGFEDSLIPSIDTLELKERANLIAHSLHDYLPDDFEVASRIILESIRDNSQDKPFDGLESFYYMPHGNFYAIYGLDHFNISINALYEITKLFTAEFAIRPFLEQYEQETLNVLRKWISDESQYVRRLVSEGTRPRLPWASRLPSFQANPTPIIELLEILKNDESLLVRRSVANNLNDIAKDHPDLVVDILNKWKPSASEEIIWIINHASRTLVKQGHVGALELLGYSSEVKVEVTNLSTVETASIGDEFFFELAVTSHEKHPVQLMIDYIVYYMKANGKQSPKVFKLSKRTINSGESISIKKKLNMTPMSTRKLYPGAHRIEIQINGKSKGEISFKLKD